MGWHDDEGRWHRGDIPTQTPTRPVISAFPSTPTRSSCNSLTLALLCAFLGAYGGHCFYAKKIGWGIAYLLTAGLFGIGIMRDLYLMGKGAYYDGNGYSVEESKFARVWFIIVIILTIIYLAIIIFAAIQ